MVADIQNKAQDNGHRRGDRLTECVAVSQIRLEASDEVVVHNQEVQMPQISLTVNRKQESADVEARTLLVELLRDKLGFTGTHIGCDTSQCGACVVKIDGMSVKSCTMLAVQAADSTVTTIEGLVNADGSMHPMQEMFREHHALQCGYCTPGMVMSAIDLVESHPEGLTDQQIRHGLEGNLCRCTGYHNIVKAIAAAWSLMHNKPLPIAAE